MEKKLKFFFTKKIVFFRFLGFNLQIPDTKLRPTNTVKSKDTSPVSKDSAM